MRFKLYSRLTAQAGLAILCAFLACRPAAAYNLGDQTIHRHFLNAARRFTQSPTLWQVTHLSPRTNNLPASYTAIAHYPTRRERPQFVFFVNGDIHEAHITGTEQLRRISSVLRQPAQSPDIGEPGHASWTSLTPYGAFEFASIFAHSDLLTSRLFTLSEENVFSGVLRIIGGRPIWQYDAKDGSPWLVRFERGLFFPAEIIWADTENTRHVWRFELSQAYAPHGLAEFEINKITYSRIQSGINAPKDETAWVLLNRFKPDQALSEIIDATHGRAASRPRAPEIASLLNMDIVLDAY